MFFFLERFIFKKFFISLELIIPGLNILGLSVKSTTVDSIPILTHPINNYIYLFFKFLIDIKAFTGLNLDERFALGIARGNFNTLSSDLIILLLGNLIATVFRLEVANETISSLYFFRMKVIGPGQNFLYNLKKFLFIIMSLLIPFVS